MKKLGKFIFGTVSLATIAAGAYYFYKNYIKKDASDDFDDFEDDFEDFDTEEETDDDDDKNSRGYVSLNITSDENEKSEEEGFSKEDEESSEE